MTGVLSVVGSTLGTPLTDLLSSNDAIIPGATVSYQLCKTIYLYHPLGAKLAEKPIELAQSQRREITVPDSPEDDVRNAFESEWNAMHCDQHIFNTRKLSRVYGISSVACLTEGDDVAKPLDFWALYRKQLSFNVYDPLNTAGSLVLNQNPMAMNFQHVTDIAVSGRAFHRSRTRVVLNESPIYIAYTHSAFGFVGRSIYQRSIYPLKSFVQTMVTDDLVSVKAGVIVAKIKQAASVIDNAMQKLFGYKRNVVKEAKTGNVIGIGTEEEIESLNLQNLEGPATMARKNILENIATATPMPAKLVTNESLSSTFSEGSEDAKEIARYVDRERVGMGDLYDYFDKIVRHRAWNPDFYATIQAKYPDYKKVDYKTAFYQWTNSFHAVWPSLLIEPESERAKADKVKLDAVIELLEALGSQLDQYNRTILIKWCIDQFNGLKELFGSAMLNLDYDKLEDFTPPEMKEDPFAEPKPKPKMSAADAIDYIKHDRRIRAV